MKGSRALMLIGLGLLILWAALFFATAVITFLLPVMWRVGLGFLAGGAIFWIIEKVEGGQSHE